MQKNSTLPAELGSDAEATAELIAKNTIAKLTAISHLLVPSRSLRTIFLLLNQKMCPFGSEIKKIRFEKQMDRRSTTTFE